MIENQNNEILNQVENDAFQIFLGSFFMNTNMDKWENQKSKYVTVDMI